MISISNGVLRAQIDPDGAQLKALAYEGGENLLWRGDAQYWSGVSPILFPICGGMRDGQYHYNGQTYLMPKHGFARKMRFEVESQEEDSVWFSLSSSPKTLEIYPFSFVLLCGFTLVGSRLAVRWQVENRGENTMPFSIGGHPAFAIDLEDTDVILPYENALPVQKLANNAYFSGQTRDVALNGNRLELKAGLFSDDALFFDSTSTRQVSLSRRGGDPFVTVACEGFPYVGIWMPSGGAPFVCIEPWMGSPDNQGHDQNIVTKADMVCLSAGSQWEGGYEIRLPSEK